MYNIETWSLKTTYMILLTLCCTNPTASARTKCCPHSTTQSYRWSFGRGQVVYSTMPEQHTATNALGESHTIQIASCQRLPKFPNASEHGVALRTMFLIHKDAEKGRAPGSWQLHSLHQWASSVGQPPHFPPHKKGRAVQTGVCERTVCIPKKKKLELVPVDFSFRARG